MFFSEERATSKPCEIYLSKYEEKTSTSDPIFVINDVFMGGHYCSDYKYYLTFKPTLINVSVDVSYINFGLSKEKIE